MIREYLSLEGKKRMEERGYHWEIAKMRHTLFDGQEITHLANSNHNLHKE
jgi:hypothetical protein